MPKRIVITGIGIVSPIGTGKDAFWSNLVNGKSGIKNISLFDTSEMNCKTGGEIPEFDALNFMEGKSAAPLDRTAQLVCAAVKLAIDDAGLNWSEMPKPRTGVLIGSTLGHLHIYSTFDRTQLGRGFLAASAKDFANCVGISNVGHASVLYGMEAFNGLVSMGSSSSLGAINLGASFIKLGRADVVFAGGVEPLFVENFLQFYLPGTLSGSRNGEPELCAPFDRKRNGIILGEGSAVAVLEDYEHAIARGAKIYAEVLGYGTAFDPEVAIRPNRSGKSLIKAMGQALKRSDLAPDAIDYVSANGNSTVDGDATETVAIKTVFGDTSNNLRYSAIKSMTGECFSASAAMQVCASALTLNSGLIPPTINYEDPDPDCGLPLSSKSQEGAISTAMINTLDDSGIAAALVIGRTNGARTV